MTRTTRRSPLLRRLLSATAVVALSAPVLTSCGFNYATNRVNTIQMGISERDGLVDALGTVLVSAQPGSGTLVTTLVNNDPENAALVEDVTGTGEPTVTAQGFSPITIEPQDRVVLAGGDDGIDVEGDFVPGDFVPVELTFADASTVAINIPVVPDCRQWEGLDTSAEADALQPEAAEPELGEEEADQGDLTGEDESPYDCVLPEPAGE